MRLIDADAEIDARTEEIQKYERRIEELEGKNEPDNIRIKHLINVCKGNITELGMEIAMLKSTKTAYDTDKVMMEMKGNSFERYGNVGMGGQKVVDLGDALEIVLKGADVTNAYTENKDCKYKDNLNDAGYCAKECAYCTYEQETRCKTRKAVENGNK